MSTNDILKLIKKIIKELKTESTYTIYGEGFKAGKIDILKYLLTTLNK